MEARLNLPRTRIDWQCPTMSHENIDIHESFHNMRTSLGFRKVICMSERPRVQSVLLLCVRLGASLAQVVVVSRK